MILNPGLLTTAAPIRQLLREMADLGHHSESARTPADGGSADLEYPAVVTMARALARQYADDAAGIHHYLAACGLDSETAEPGSASADHMPHFTRHPALGRVIACTCGEAPERRASRASMQHTWHQTHRRRLHLPPVAYVEPDGW